MSTHHIEKPADAFLPIVGQVAWSVRRGHGTFLTMEFGSPHLIIREPIVAVSDASVKVKRNLAKRRVTIVGDWHFWVQHAQWEIQTANYSIKSENTESVLIEAALSDLDGQILISAEPGTAPNCSLLKFDLGASLHISSSPELDDDLWSLHAMGGRILTCDANGNVLIDNAPSAQGS